MKRRPGRREASRRVLDLRTIAPLDTESIVRSVRKTYRLVVAQEAWLRFSVGSEIVAVVAEEAHDALAAPLVRVGAKYAPIPFSPILEDHVLPAVEDIEAAVRTTLGAGPEKVPQAAETAP